MSQPLLLPGGTGSADVHRLGVALGETLGRSGPPLIPYDPARPPQAVDVEVGNDIPEDVAVALQTSGSTSEAGHLVGLSASALRASAEATYARLAGPGQWVACLPTHHIAGLQVLVRSYVAGTTPVVLDTRQGFRAEELAEAVTGLDAQLPGYLSLVPTQLMRVLAAGEDVVAPLRRLAAILVGGSATSQALLAQAAEAGLPVVTTYGMTETGGGCVYDGQPLPGVEVALGEGGRILLSGPVLAEGYLDDPTASAATFIKHEEGRWLRTTDHGTWQDGRLHVNGRLDDVVISGGRNVALGLVATTLADTVEAVVVGIGDDEWGSLVTAVTTGQTPRLEELRSLVTERLGAHHAPRALIVVDRLPQRGPGKPDRQTAAAIAQEALGKPPFVTDDEALAAAAGCRVRRVERL